VSARSWVKLYIEILDDPKMGRLAHNLWRRLIELILLAGRTGNDGALPPVEEMAWTLRLSRDRLLEDLHSLAEIGEVHEAQPGSWIVTNFAKRQSPVPLEERVRMSRLRNAAVTKRYISDNVDAAGDSSSTSASESDSDSVSFSDSGSVSDSASESKSDSGTQPENSLRLPRSPAEALAHPDLQVFLAATGGRVPAMEQYRVVIETVRLLRTGKRLDDAALAAYLEPFWRAWTGRRRRDGKPYDRGNISWLTEWAVNGAMPGNTPAESPADVIRSVARRKK
jgi:hypothetical protein